MHLKSDTLLLTDVFENFRKIYLEICELDPAKFLFSSSISMASNFKVEFELITDKDMLLMVEKRIRGGMCHAINQYAKDNKYMKNYDKNKESYLHSWDVNNLYGWAMSQKLL